MSDDTPWSSMRAPAIAVLAAVAVLIILPLALPDTSAAGGQGVALSVVEAGGAAPGFAVRLKERAQVTVVCVDGSGHARVCGGPSFLQAGESALPAASLPGDQRYLAFACVFPASTEVLMTAARARNPGIEGCSFDLLMVQKPPGER